jgi:hypothetical protein
VTRPHAERERVDGGGVLVLGSANISETTPTRA